MIKVGSVVQWQGKSGKLTGKVIASSGNRWKIESGGKSYFAPKDKVKRGYNKKKTVVKNKKPKPLATKPNAEGKEVKETTGQKNLQALLGLGDLSSMIQKEKTKVNEKRKEKLEDVYFGDLEEATTRAHKEQYGAGLKHHPNTSRDTMIRYIFKKGLNVEKHLKDIEREDKEREDKRKKEYEAGIAKMEKQAPKGTLPWGNFEGYVSDDNRFRDEYDIRIDNVRESYTWGSDFYRLVKRVTKRDVDSFSDLTESQQEKYQELLFQQADRDHSKYLKTLYDEVIKKKKFKSLKEAVDVFIKKYKED